MLTTGRLRGYGVGKTSTLARLNLSAVGAVSFMVTVVPLKGVTVFWRCTQYVLPTLEST